MNDKEIIKILAEKVLQLEAGLENEGIGGHILPDDKAYQYIAENLPGLMDQYKHFEWPPVWRGPLDESLGPSKDSHLLPREAFDAAFKYCKQIKAEVYIEDIYAAIDLLDGAKGWGEAPNGSLAELEIGLDGWGRVKP